LKKHFSQPEKLINAHTLVLIKLPGATNELSSLQLFHDVTEIISEALHHLGYPRNHTAQFLYQQLSESSLACMKELG